MMYEPKRDAARSKSRRITKRVLWLLSLPVGSGILCWGLLRRLFCSAESAKMHRAHEKDRQAGIRRELRGLPASHDGGKPIA